MNKNVYYESKRNFITDDINVFMSTIGEEKINISINQIRMLPADGGKPFVEIDFKILNGKYKDLHVDIKQMIVNGFQVCDVNNFLRQLVNTRKDFTSSIEFKSFKMYDLLLQEINNKTKDKEICFNTKQI